MRIFKPGPLAGTTAGGWSSLGHYPSGRQVCHMRCLVIQIWRITLELWAGIALETVHPFQPFHSYQYIHKQDATEIMSNKNRHVWNSHFKSKFFLGCMQATSTYNTSTFSPTATSSSSFLLSRCTLSLQKLVARPPIGCWETANWHKLATNGYSNLLKDVECKRCIKIY